MPLGVNYEKYSFMNMLQTTKLLKVVLEASEKEK
jgi:hypothetical protein